MVRGEGVAKVLLPAAVGVDVHFLILVLLHEGLRKNLLQVCHVPGFESSIGLDLIGPLREEMSPEGLSQLGGNHIPPGGAWRKHGLGMHARCGNVDWPGGGTMDFRKHRAHVGGGPRYRKRIGGCLESQCKK